MTCTTWGDSLVEIGDFDLARTTFRKAIAVAETIAPDELFVQPHVLGRIAEAQARIGDKVAARETFLKCGDAADRITARNRGKIVEWSQIVHEAARSLNVLEAADIFKRYEHEIETSPDRSVVSTRETLRLRLLIYRGDYDAAARLIADPALFKADPRSRSGTAGMIIAMFRGDNSHLSSDRKAAALRLIEAQKEILLANKELPNNAFDRNNLGLALAGLGRVDDGIAALEAIDPLSSQSPAERDGTRRWKAKGFIDLAELLLKAGDKSGAIDAARRVFEILAKTERENANAYELNLAIDFLARGRPRHGVQGVGSTRTYGRSVDLVIASSCPPSRRFLRRAPPTGPGPRTGSPGLETRGRPIAACDHSPAGREKASRREPDGVNPLPHRRTRRVSLPSERQRCGPPSDRRTCRRHSRHRAGRLAEYRAGTGDR